MRAQILGIIQHVWTCSNYLKPSVKLNCPVLQVNFFQIPFLSLLKCNLTRTCTFLNHLFFRLCYCSVSWIDKWNRRLNQQYCPSIFEPDSSIALVIFSSCQRNLIKTFQIEAIIALITEMAMIFSWVLLMAKNSCQKSQIF